jgi:UDP-N-acetylglucosamine--N-acetylmuramyl-(pentapeptide) pyrophosphoryl-undecaprenol N-acetylglucosamine transferase
VIGWYVHHHGRGHLARAEAVLPHLDRPCTLLTSADLGGARLAGASVLPLPLDVADGPTPSALHYAPLRGEGLRRRMAAIAGWIDRAAPDALVVDVSVEVAALARLHGVPVVVARQHGDRRDPPHRLVHDLASAFLAPYPAELEDPTTAPDVRVRTCYAGLLSRFDGRSVDRGDARRRLGVGTDERLVVVLGGAGGRGVDVAAVDAAATANPGWRWMALGVGGPHGAGWVDDPLPHLRAADVVVAAAGSNAVSEVLAADRPLVCSPEPRPFDEQHAKAAALQRVGAAVVVPSWPAAAQWSALLERALALDPAVRRRLADGRGAERAAAHLRALADRPVAVPA